jgi:glycosyltransferase involved in cell wall biosynthesis
VSCLEHLSKQSLPDQLFEVIVVDNNSTDNTASLVKNFLSDHITRPFRYVFEEKKGLSNARNRGIAEAKGEVILYLDDDAESEPELLDTYYNFFSKHMEASGAGGKILPRFSEAPEPAWISRWLDGYLARMDPGGEARPFKGRMKYPFGCNMAYRKMYLEKIGGFNTDITFRGDDKYIFLEINHLNPNIYYLPNAVVHHNIPASRLQADYFKTLFLKTGNEEKVRLNISGNFFSRAKKLLEYIIKWKISLILWMIYALKGQPLKGEFIQLSQWYTLKGFLKDRVDVR